MLFHFILLFNLLIFNFLSSANLYKKCDISFAYISNAPITSTFINADNEIIEHKDDGDPTIYIVPKSNEWNGEKEGLVVFGFEKLNVNYKNNIGTK